MKSSYIALGYRCNHNCMNCPLSDYDRNRNELEYEIIKKHILDITNTDEDVNVTISGGEPTLNPNFFEVMKLLGKKNVYITLLTNSTTFKNIEYVDKFKEALGKEYNYNKLVVVSAIHSSSPSIHDKLTGVKGSLEETVQGLKNLSSRNIRVVVKYIMNKVNATCIKDTMEYICNTFPKDVDIHMCAMDYAGRCMEHTDELYINFEELGPYVENALDWFEENSKGRRLYIFETPLCLVDAYYWKYYNITDNHSLTYIAPNNEKEENRSDKVESLCNSLYNECSTCKVRNYCDGIWRSTYNVETDKSKIIRPVIEQNI